MKKWIICSFVLLFAAALAMPLAAQESATSVRPPKLDFTSHTLPNGLRVILLEEHEVPVINLQVWYHVGAKEDRKSVV